MNKKYIKIGAITLVSLGAIYGGYKLYKYLSKPTEEDSLPVDIVDTSGNEEVKKASAPAFSGSKIVSKGSKGDEAKTIQQTLNNIISDAKKALAIKAKTNIPTNTATQNLVYSPTLGWFNSKETSISTASYTRLKEVASLTPLTINGIFDANSVSVLGVIMGKSSASYNEVRDKRLAFAKAYGLGNPYQN